MEISLFPKDGFHFFLCLPGKFVTRVNARKSDSCRILAALFPDHPMLFIFQGQLLSMSDTFGSYRISFNDSVIGLPDRDKDSADARIWLRATRDSILFDEMLQSISNPYQISEAGRLRDLALIRTEVRPRQFRRAIKKLDEMQNTEPPAVAAKSVIGDVPTKMSTAELPRLL
jgi:hypothetical protein